MILNIIQKNANPIITNIVLFRNIIKFTKIIKTLLAARLLTNVYIKYTHLSYKPERLKFIFRLMLRFCYINFEIKHSDPINLLD